MADISKTFYCEKCNRTMGVENFYKSNNLEKYPNGGKMPICKKCMTSRVDNWDSRTFLWILQEADVPYIPEEWDKLLASYGKDKSKVTGTTILGRYLSKMKLKKWKDYRWKDNEFLQQLSNHKIEEAMKLQGYEQSEITKAVERNSYELPKEPLPVPEINPYDAAEPVPEDNSTSDMVTTGPASRDYFDDTDEEIELSLTKEERLALRIKWGRTYRPDEWIYLEKLYTEMMESYDIQTAGHIDTLKMICKTSLKANQLLDMGDVDGAQKMIKTYDTLMRSGKFTAAQNKSENGEYIDCISQLVALCEKEGFIPRYYIDQPNDKVDRVIQDMQEYTTTLVTEEAQLGTLIEKAIKQIEEDRAKDQMTENANSSEDAEFEEELFSHHDDDFLTDLDYDDFNTFIDEQEEQDASFYKSIEGK